MRNNLLYTKEERDSLRHTKIFNDTNKIWNDYSHNKRTNIGTISYLLRSAHNLFCGNTSNLMTFEQWEMFYLRSGAKRAELLSKSSDLTKEEITKIDLYYGRTIQDIHKITEAFKKSLDENGYKISYSKVFNYCYIRIVDEAYIGYKREYNTLHSLREVFPDYQFDFADDYDDVQLGIDIMVQKNGKLVGGFQVKSDIYRDSDRTYNIDAKNVNNKKFKRCKKEKGFTPKYIYVDRTGKVSEPYPNLKF